MKTIAFGLMMAFLIHAPAGPPLAAQAGEADPRAHAVGSAMHREMAGMRRSLDEIAALLAAALEQQQVAVLMSRMELKQRRLEPLESGLARARRERDSLRQEHRELNDMRDIFRKEMEEQAETRQQAQRQLDQVARRLEQLEDRMRNLDQEIIEREDDLAANEEDIAILEEMVDERLSLR